MTVRRDRDLHVVAGQELDLVDGHQVRRIGHGEGERRPRRCSAASAGAWQPAKPASSWRMSQADLETHGVDDRQAVFLLEVRIELVLGQKTEPHQMRRQEIPP